EGGECAVVGEALEDFRDVGDPEGTVEAGADFVEPLGKAHVSDGRKAASAPPSMRGGMIAERGTPHPGWFWAKSAEAIEKKRVDFYGVQKGVQECERKRLECLGESKVASDEYVSGLNQNGNCWYPPRQFS